MNQKKYKKIKVKTWHLFFERQLPSVSNLCELIHWKNPKSIEYLALYKLVGSKWGWCGRLLLSSEELEDKLNSTFNQVWLFKSEGFLRGFFEIDRSKKGVAEIVYLGLLPEEIGRGYGKTFLDAAITTASGPTRDRVWLHTCEYDHPKALEMYLKAGFVITKETVEKEYYPTDFIANV
jgi:GNAT superfamily N-acetyltransferase